ncbi:MAG: hypothetical protein IKE22_00830 [Atopobiaceae bacterium]|nr:hypothetical protein [Atopobiaceae bacterium]
MRLPSKITPYKASVLAKFPFLLKPLREGALKPSDLYNKTRSRLSGLGEFVLVLDCLFALGAVEFDDENGVIRYAG